jgi:hypothetical protein
VTAPTSALVADLVESLHPQDRARVARALAPAVAELLAANDREPAQDHWLTAADAAQHLGVTRKRIHDLTSMGALVPDGRDGRTPLYRRATLDAYVTRSA